MSQPRRLAATLLCLGLCVACAPKFMPAPNLYAKARQPLFEDLAPELASTQLEVFYVTDRAREDDGSEVPRYGYERSASVGYGLASVVIGGDLSWQELVAYSTTPFTGGGRPSVRVGSIVELGRLPATPYLFKVQAQGQIELAPEVLAEWDEALAQARRDLLERLMLTPRKEVFVYVHGVGNSFEDAILTAGQGWHFLGREGVAIAYTWPAGRGGLRFYGYDRESGEFTIFHLKQLFETLASIPEIERVHVIAHSRGTDVTTTALRELVIATRAAGVDPRSHFKIENLVLAAADLDSRST